MVFVSPTPAHLARAYYELGQLGGRAVGRKSTWPYRPATREALICLLADLSRFDPRLFEALLQWWIASWQTLNPLAIRRAMATMQTPQVFGVLGEFLLALTTDVEAAPFVRYVCDRLDALSPQMFFHHLYAPGGRKVQQASEAPVREFQRWGFLSDMRPVVAQAQKQTCGNFGPPARKQLLRRLLARQSNIALRDYHALLGHTISRQQAYADLKRYPGLRRRGHGAGATWQLG